MLLLTVCVENETGTSYNPSKLKEVTGGHLICQSIRIIVSERIDFISVVIRMIHVILCNEVAVADCPLG